MVEGGIIKKNLEKINKWKLMSVEIFWGGLYVYEAAHGFNGQDVLLSPSSRYPSNIIEFNFDVFISIKFFTPSANHTLPCVNFEIIIVSKIFLITDDV